MFTTNMQYKIKSYLQISKKIEELVQEKRAIIFDMDGTLVNLEKANLECYRKVIKEMYGINVSSTDWEAVFQGKRPQESVPCFLRLKGRNQTFNFSKFKLLITPLKDEILTKKIDQMVQISPGAYHYLNILKKTKKLALTTSTIRRYTKIILTHFNIYDLFDVIITGDNLARGKPDPEIYNKTLQVLKMSPQECLVFEDSKVGIESAKAARIQTVKIAWKTKFF